VKRASIIGLLFLGIVLLAGCGSEQNDAAPEKGHRLRPVELLLTEDGQPDPSVLAVEQVLHRANGEEPQTLDPHLAQGVPRLIFSGTCSKD